MKTKLTQDDLNNLAWYINRANRGYGRITPESKRFLNRGLLIMTRLSRYAWMLTLSKLGREVLHNAGMDGDDRGMCEEITTKA